MTRSEYKQRIRESKARLHAEIVKIVEEIGDRPTPEIVYAVWRKLNVTTTTEYVNEILGR